MVSILKEIAPGILVALGNGIAPQILLDNEKEKAVETRKEILSVKGWSGFGYITEEVRFKRQGLKP